MGVIVQKERIQHFTSCQTLLPKCNPAVLGSEMFWFLFRYKENFGELLQLDEQV